MKENSIKLQSKHLKYTDQIKDLTDRLTQLQNTHEKFTQQVKENDKKELNQMKEELEKLNHRHQTALELLGEKEEQVEELKADLFDVKQLYKTQINELVSKLNL